MRFSLFVAALILAAAPGCGDDGASPSDAGLDGGVGRDAAAPDAPPGDTGAPADAGGPDVDPGSDTLWFEDVTARAGIDFDRVTAAGYVEAPDRFSGGVCVLDADGAGPLDLFFAMRPSVSGGSRLYVASAPFAYEDETAARGLGDAGDASACLAFDADGDEDDDLAVTGLGTLRYYENLGGSFVHRPSALPPVDARDLYGSTSAGDVDGDGDLDLLVGGMLRYDPSILPPPDECRDVPCAAQFALFEKIPDLLLMREGGRWIDRAAELAPDLRRAEPGLVMSIEDLDEDGRPELYVGNDLGGMFFDRVLKRGADGIFRDVAVEMGLATDARGYGIDTMAWSSGDFDRDGHIDHVSTSFDGFATSLFLCAEGICEDRGVALGTGATETTFRWGAALADFDSDGWLDLFEVTGHLHTDDEIASGGLHGSFRQRPSLSVQRAGALVLVDPEPDDALAGPLAGRGIAVADLDDDGRLDVVIAPTLGRPAVLRNVHRRAGHWLRVTLRGPGARTAGALVEVEAGEIVLRKQRLLGEGFQGNFDPRMTFGLPGAEPVDVAVHWPDGSATRMENVGVDRSVEVGPDP